MTLIDDKNATEYATRWRFLRRQYRLLWGVILTFFPAVGVSVLVSSRLRSIIPFFVIWLCWAVAMTVVNLRFTGFPCPRCGKAFFRRGGLNRPSAFEPRCVHCGLPKWASAPDPNSVW